MSLPAPNIQQVKQDLFAPHLEPLETWAPWDTFTAAAFGLPLPDPALYEQCTGRKAPPENAVRKAVREAWMVVGRRGGKSRITALIATYLGCFHDYARYLSPGESGLVLVLATDRMQARVIIRYIEAFILNTPVLAGMVVRRSAETIELGNRITIQVTSATLRAPRGYTVVAALCDEIAFWRSDDSANPDQEILTSLRPAMSTIPNAMLICLSSPYARRGAMWETHRKYYGQESEDVLVWRAPTWVMNPTISQSFLDRERERDPVAFQSEYGAQFRVDIRAALEQDWIDNALCLPNLDVPKALHPQPYIAFADMSGGRMDAATVAIAHQEPGEPHVSVDLLRRWPAPFKPGAVVTEMAECLSRYGLQSVIGDNYSAELTVELFNQVGITYRRSEDSATELYLQAVPMFSTGKIQAPDHPILRTELTALERRSRVSGKDLITHPPGAHDDLANALCGAAVNAYRAATDAAESSQAFPAEWIRLAQGRWTPEPTTQVPVCSLGVSRNSNQTLIAMRRDGWYAPIITGGVTSAQDVAGFVVSRRRDSALVMVDVESANGAEIVGHLKTNGIDVKGFHATGESFRRTEDRQLTFKNKLSEAAWRFREALNPDQPGGSRIALPDDPELVGDLTAFRYEVKEKGIEVTRSRPAPRADAVVLSWSGGPTITTHYHEWKGARNLSGRDKNLPTRVNFGPNHHGSRRR